MPDNILILVFTRNKASTIELYNFLLLPFFTFHIINFMSNQDTDKRED